MLLQGKQNGCGPSLPHAVRHTHDAHVPTCTHGELLVHLLPACPPSLSSVLPTHTLSSFVFFFRLFPSLSISNQPHTTLQLQTVLIFFNVFVINAVYEDSSTQHLIPTNTIIFEKCFKDFHFQKDDFSLLLNFQIKQEKNSSFSFIFSHFFSSFFLFFFLYFKNYFFDFYFLF